MNENAVLTCAELAEGALQALLAPYHLTVITVADDQPLPGSFWGDPEAGLVGDRLFVRPVTPVQSALHEACHYICMDRTRRANLDTDAGGGYDEENGVCYLQILLADGLAEMGRERMMLDMDRWGYSFRLGSARAWFESDAEDARQWLRSRGIIDATDRPTGQRCNDPAPQADIAGITPST